MEPLWIGIAGIFFLFVLFFAGVYIAVALGVVGFLGITAIIGVSPAMTLLATTIFHYGTMYSFIVVPLFVAMGLFSNESGVSSSMYDTLSKWVGQIRGGLGIATVGACTIFGTLTGSSIVTSIVFAKVSVPEMKRYGYDAKTAYGLVSAAGAIGMMIPPSMMAVIYGVLTEQSIGMLLMAGIGPGLVLAFCLIVGFVILLFLRPSLGPTTGVISTTWRERFVGLLKMWPACLTALVIIGGIYSGLLTVDEASGIGAFLLLLLYLITKGFSRQSWQVVAASLRESVSLCAMLIIIVTNAYMFGRFLVLSGLAATLSNFIIDMNLSGMQFIIIASFLYLLLGCILDPISIVAMTVPLFTPIVKTMGIDPIWFAMILILATQIGLITPPVGMSVYAVKAVAGPDYSLGDIFRGCMPFLYMMIVALAIVIAFPIISTWIPYYVWK
jgi:C4-dicarboxylate transporter DctM subunit